MRTTPKPVTDDSVNRSLYLSVRELQSPARYIHGVFPDKPPSPLHIQEIHPLFFHSGDKEFIKRFDGILCLEPCGHTQQYNNHIFSFIHEPLYLLFILKI